MTLVASALAGGDCIDDADVLRTGGTACTLGSVVKAPSTLGTFLRSFRWGHVRQLPGESRVAGHGLEGRRWTRRRTIHHRPGFDDLRDLGLAKEGPGTRGYHPLLAVAAGTGDSADVPAARGPGRPTSCVKRWGGFATAGPAGSSLCGPTAASIPTPWSPSAAGWMSASPSPSEPAQSRRPEDAWTPIPDARAPTFQMSDHHPAGAAHARLPTGSLRHLRYHGFITVWRLTIAATPRSRTRYATSYGVGLNHLPSGRFAANGAWLAVQVMAHNLARWTARMPG